MRTVLRGLGVVIPVFAGLGYILVTNTASGGSQLWLVVSALLLEAIAGLVSGMLLGSLSALLVVPSGLVLGAVAGVFLSGNWYALNDFFFIIMIMFMVVTFGVASLPSVAAAFFGVRIGRRFSEPRP